MVACDGLEQRGAGLAPPDVLGEDVFVRVLEGLTPRSGRSVESGQGGVQLGVESGGRTQRGADEDA